jgi:hypothetical protein
MRKDMSGWKGVTYKTKDSKGGVNLAFNAVLNREHLDEDYIIEVPKESKVTKQDLLAIGRLEPKTGSLPRFLFRWDEKAKHVNVDIYGVDGTVKKWFEKGQNGYSGHKVEQDGTFFDIDILIPSKHVFKGRINFNLALAYELIARIGLKPL